MWFNLEFEFLFTIFFVLVKRQCENNVCDCVKQFQCVSAYERVQCMCVFDIRIFS